MPRKPKANRLIWGKLIHHPEMKEHAVKINTDLKNKLKLYEDEKCDKLVIFGVDHKGYVTTYLFTNKEIK